MRADEKKKLYENLKHEIRSLLISSPKTKYGGLTGSLLYADYKQLNCGKEIPYAELGFHSFLAFLRSMPDVVKIECKEGSLSYRVHPVYDQATAHIQKMVLEQRDKYEYQNRTYNDHWHSTGYTPLMPFNVCNNRQPPFLHQSFSCYNWNTMERNIPSYSNYSYPRYNHSTVPSNYRSVLFPIDVSVPQRLPQSNRQQNHLDFQPYSLLMPQNARISTTFVSLSPRVPSKSNSNPQIYSTPNPLTETPLNFELNDYRLSEATKSSEKDTDKDDNKISSHDNQIATEDDPLLTTSVSIVSVHSERDQSSILPSESSTVHSITSSVSDTNISTENSLDRSPYSVQSCVSIVKEDNRKNPCIGETSRKSNESDEEKENKELLKRVNDALRQCVHFRYMHRLCELQFQYRSYPSSTKLLLMKSELEKVAYQEYKQELEQFERRFQITSFIDENKCQQMFDEYISLQRNYYYMIKLIKKRQL